MNQTPIPIESLPVGDAYALEYRRIPVTTRFEQAAG